MKQSHSKYLLIILSWIFTSCRIPPPSSSSLSNWKIATEQFGVRSGYPLHSRHTVGSGYGKRIHPVTGRSTVHHGQDFPCRKGAWIRAVASGEVTISEHSKTAGHYIELIHPQGTGTVHTRYMHLHRRHARVGDTVSRGEIIGTCGSTGRSTGPHLHFELRHNGQSIPPLILKVKRESGIWDALNGY